MGGRQKLGDPPPAPALLRMGIPQSRRQLLLHELHRWPEPGHSRARTLPVEPARSGLGNRRRQSHPVPGPPYRNVDVLPATRPVRDLHRLLLARHQPLRRGDLCRRRAHAAAHAGVPHRRRSSARLGLSARPLGQNEQGKAVRAGISWRGNRFDAHRSPFGRLDSLANTRDNPGGHWRVQGMGDSAISQLAGARPRPSLMEQADLLRRRGSVNWQTISARVLPGLEKLGRKLHFDEVHVRRVWTAAGCALVLCGILWQRCGLGGCPNVARLTSYQPNGATVLLDRNGRPFADLAPVHYKVVPLETLPSHITDAFLAVEDKRFFKHNGVDWRRVAGAALVNVKSGQLRQGSSTITMQLTRNLFPKEVPGRERTLRRKLLEVRVARMIERKFEKKDILELYLNHIYFGNGAYGIDAASRHYYRKPASKLTASQAALIAALPKAPSRYDPRRHATRAKERRNLVLDLMAEQGKLDSAKAKAAKAMRLAISPRPRRDNQDDGLAPYFVDLVRRQLEDRFGDVLYERRLRVYTTLDTRAQRASEEELFRQLRDLEAGAYGRINGPRYASNAVSDEQGTRYLQGAVVIMDVRTGNVLALVGGRDFIDSNFNRATQSQRQLGSAFKPFV